MERNEMIIKSRKNWVSILEHGSIVFNSEKEEIIDICSACIFKSFEAYQTGNIPCYVDYQNVNAFIDYTKKNEKIQVEYATKESIVGLVKHKFGIVDLNFAEFIGEQCLRFVNGESIEKYIMSLDGDDLDAFVMDYSQKGGDDNVQAV